MSKRLRQFERLETRQVFAADWQNPILTCDVDDSGLVNPLDVLVIVNSINATGSRDLSSTPREASSPFYDVSGDSNVSPFDALLVVNAINRAAPDVAIAFGTDPSDDPNSNGVVQVDVVSLTGQSAPFGKLTLTQTAVLSAESSVYHADLDANGRFSFDVPVAVGINRFHISVVDELGRTKSIDREIRRGDLVADWNAAVLNVVRDWTTTSNDPYEGRIVPARPPEVARNLAMIHAAIFDAVNAVQGRYEPYAFDGTVAGASPSAAAAKAAQLVASSLYKDADELAIWTASLDETLATIPDDEARAKGLELGTQVANKILEIRQNDGAKASVSYVPGDAPGDWNRTFPDYLPALLPQWPGVKPFGISDAEAFRPAPPPTLDSSEYASAVDEVMRLGSLNSTERTDEQTEIALFWADGGGTATPPGHWNVIASDVVARESLSLIVSARTFALLNFALADAGIVAWDAKYAYNIWRPIDAIRQADLDGNDATHQDTTWLPLLKTPPFPTYVSGHSTFSGAAAAVLTDLFGEDYSFESTSDSHSGLSQRPLNESLVVTRSFTSFSQAAEEAGISRIYGGIHFAFDNTSGLSAGRNVGHFVTSQRLKPK